jgi:hypothetical protein
LCPPIFPVISRSRWFFVSFMCSSVQTENTTAVLFVLIHMWFFLILARPFTCDFFSSWLVLCTSWAVLPAASSLVFLPHQSPVFVSCLGPHCSQDRFGFVFLPLSTVRDLFSSRSYFNFFGPHLRSIASRPLSVLFDFMFFSRACRALPGLVVTCALLFLVRFSFSWVENGGLSSLLARTQLAFFGWVAGVASSTSIFSVFVISDFVGIVVGWSRCHF